MKFWNIDNQQENHLRNDGIKFENMSLEELKEILSSLEKSSDEKQKENNLLNEEKLSFPLKEADDYEVEKLRLILKGLIRIIEEQNEDLSIQKKELTVQKRNATIQRIGSIIIFVIFNLL